MTTPSIAEQAGSIAQPLDIALDDNLLDDYALADRYNRGEGRVFLKRFGGRKPPWKSTTSILSLL